MPPFLLPTAWGTGGGRNRQPDLRVPLQQCRHQGAFSNTTGTSDQKQPAAAGSLGNHRGSSAALQSRCAAAAVPRLPMAPVSLQAKGLTSRRAVVAELKPLLLPSRFEKAQQAVGHTLQLGFRTLEQRLWLELSWQAEAPRLHAIEPPPRQGEGSTLAQQLQLDAHRLAVLGHRAGELRPGLLADLFPRFADGGVLGDDEHSLALLGVVVGYGDDLPVGEVARIVGKSIHATESLLARGRSALRASSTGSTTTTEEAE